MANKTEDLNTIQQEIDASMKALGNQIPEKARPLIKEAMLKMKVDQLFPKDALGLTPQTLEVIYQQGYQFFQNGKYPDALLIFDILRQMDITDPRYSFAIAACYHYSKDYLNAAANYLITQSMDPLNPFLSFHLYDCYKKAGHPISALQSIQEALILAEKSSEYASLKEKIQLEFDHFKEELKKSKELKN